MLYLRSSSKLGSRLEQRKSNKGFETHIERLLANSQDMFLLIG